MSTDIVKKHELPKLSDLVEDTEMKMKDNALTVILNQPPPENWLKEHPTVKGLRYIPIQRIEWLLTSIYGKWSVEIKSAQIHANSEVVIVKLTVTNPVTGEIETQDGIGACPVQTDSGKSATDWNFVKSAGVQMAAPAAEAYAIKDAAEKFGKIFGKDLGRKDAIGYETLLKEKTEYDWVELTELYDFKVDAVPETERHAIRKIIDEQIKTQYSKVKNYLSKL